MRIPEKCARQSVIVKTDAMNGVIRIQVRLDSSMLSIFWGQNTSDTMRGSSVDLLRTAGETTSHWVPLCMFTVEHRDG
jgi:hypothetical protein